MDYRNYSRLAGDLVSEARSRAGMTQTELAQAAGVTQTVVSAYENRRRQPTLPTLCRLLAAAGFAPSIELRPLGRVDVFAGQLSTSTGDKDEVESVSMGDPSGPVGSLVTANRDTIREVIRRHGAVRPRVFGSVARGEDHEGSDLDIIVRAPDGFTLLDQAAIITELRELLGVRVDVITEGALDGDAARQVDAEAVPL